jgi:hypothetical protein
VVNRCKGKFDLSPAPVTALTDSPPPFGQNGFCGTSLRLPVRAPANYRKTAPGETLLLPENEAPSPFTPTPSPIQRGQIGKAWRVVPVSPEIKLRVPRSLAFGDRGKEVRTAAALAVHSHPDPSALSNPSPVNLRFQIATSNSIPREPMGVDGSHL